MDTNYTWSPSSSFSSSSGTNVVATPTSNNKYIQLLEQQEPVLVQQTASISGMGGALTLTVTPNTSTVCAGKHL